MFIVTHLKRSMLGTFQRLNVPHRCQDSSSYVNLQGGILVRYINPAVEVLPSLKSDSFTISDLTTHTATINITSTKTLWIP